MADSSISSMARSWTSKDSLATAESIGGAVEVWGILESGRAARISAERARVRREFAAWQAEREAAVALAVGQRMAMEERRQGDLSVSRALAVAAASGGGVSDPTIVNILANARGEAYYNASIALYEGKERARKLRLDAAAGRYTGSLEEIEGRRAEEGYAIAGLGAAVRAGTTIYGKYGLGGPGKGGSGDGSLVDDRGLNN